ncbi:hypothetical protein PtB15_2B361 [Puccinia triticina]|nr:hypothetical protein PtB15_2B361 [Puccinia triticina]
MDFLEIWTRTETDQRQTPDAPITWAKDALLQLRSNLLPKLRDELIKLGDLLEGPHSMLKLMEDRKPALDECWDQI